MPNSNFDTKIDGCGKFNPEMASRKNYKNSILNGSLFLAARS